MHLAAAGPPPVGEQRKHHRVQLSLPVRLRWRTPFGLRTGLGETLEASRGGVLIQCEEACEEGTWLWVTLAFDPDTPLSQPEMPARVVRVSPRPGGGYLAALAFAAYPLSVVPFEPLRERRRSARTRLALPMRVQLEGVPWAEETMTVDVSAEGALFGAARVYQAGDAVRVKLEDIPWPGRESAEFLAARVVRVVELANTSEQQAAIHLQSEGASWR